MMKLTMRGLWAHKVRYALTSLAVVLGVAFLAGTMVLTDTMQSTFDQVFATANDGTDVIVRSDAAIEGELATARERVDADVVDRVGRIDGVAVAHGAIEGPTQLVDRDGEPTTTDGLGAAIGRNWIDDERLNPFSLASGRAPAGPGEAVVDVATAEQQGWALGDSIRVLTLDGPSDLVVVGTATFGDADGVPGSSLVATDDATAQRLFAEPGRFDRVVVAADEGTSADELAARITDDVTGDVADVSPGLEALTAAQDTAEEQAALEEDLAFVEGFLFAFAYVALFVGMFIIFNTFSIVVAQRLREMALLRALGAGRRQVLASVVLESSIVGTVSAVAGLAAGIGLSFGLRALLEAGGVELPSTDLVVSTATVVTALVVGAGVSVASAVVPALRAGRVRPVAALRDVAVEAHRPSKARVVVGTLLTGAGAIAFGLGLSATDGAAALIAVGATSVILGIAVLGPVLVRPAIRVLGAPARLAGATGRYARENAMRMPKRTAATASALVIGVTLVGFITIFAASTKESIAAMVDGSFRADYVVESGSFTQGFAPTIEDDLGAVPGVATVSPLRAAPAEIDGSATDVLAVDPATIDDMYDLGVSEGAVDGLRGGVAVDADRAEADDLSVGDRVVVRFADGAELQLPIAAVFDMNTIGGEATWLVDLATFEAHVADQYDRRVFVGLDEAAPAGRDAIEAALAGWPNADLQDPGEFREAIAGQIDQMLNMIYGLLALAVVIAVLGIANTLALSVHERTRELGVLRAIGMHRRQLRRAIRIESLLISVLGTVGGAVLAVGSAWGVVRALADQGITEFTLPTGPMALIVGLGALAGVLAAAGPARRAARLDVLTAISSAG